MLSKIKIKNKNEIIALVFLIILTATFTSYYNFTKNKIKDNYNSIINNIYFKKTTKHFFNQIEPKFKKIRHQIIEGETFDNILSNYDIDSKENQNLKNKLRKSSLKIKNGAGQKLWREAKKIIPGGNQLLSKRPEMFLPENWPAYYSKAQGAHIWDLDHNKYLDMSIMGIGTCSLGYANKSVNDVVKNAIDNVLKRKSNNQFGKLIKPRT